METKNYKVGELLEMIKKGDLIREAFQRTPSHDTKKALDIIESIKEGRFAGILTFAETESKKLSIIDGSSRLQDLEDFVNNKIFHTETEVITETDGETVRTIKSKVNRTFSTLAEVERSNFLNYSFPCIVLKGTTLEERLKAFVNVNSSVSLSTIQKNKGNANDKLNELVDLFKKSNICNHIFSARLIQKDEPISFIYNVLGNIYNVYSASNAKLVESVNKLTLEDFDVARFSQILNLFNNIELTVNKYCVISHIVNLYVSNLSIDNISPFDNNVIYAVETAGANSAPANDKRLEKSLQLLNKQIGVSLKTGKPIKKGADAESVSLDEIAK